MSAIKTVLELAKGRGFSRVSKQVNATALPSSADIVKNRLKSTRFSGSSKLAPLPPSRSLVVISKKKAAKLNRNFARTRKKVKIKTRKSLRFVRQNKGAFAIAGGSLAAGGGGVALHQRHRNRRGR